MADSTFDFTQLQMWNYTSENCSRIMEIWTYIDHNDTYGFNPYYSYKQDEQEKIYRYIVEGFEQFLMSKSLQPPPAIPAFWDWVVLKHGFRTSVVQLGKDECPSQMCKVLGWEGSPDIVGVGMLATYTIQAILVTLYLFGLLAVRLDKLPPQLRNSRTLSRTLLSVQHSTAEFLSSSSMFSLSLFVASILSILRYEILTPMLWVLALVVPLNSVLPVVILHTSASNMLRRSKGRVLMWLVTDGLVFGLTIRSSFHYRNFWLWGGLSKESPCVDFDLYGITTFSHIVGGFLGFGITGYVVDSIVSVVRRQPRITSRLPDMFQWVVAGICTCVMWVFIGWLLYSTTRIRSHTGDNNEDTVWTFGQVLSVATWVPFIVEFTYIWWEDPLKALNGRLMAPYEVVVSSRQQSLLEMRSPGGDEERGHFQRLGQSPDS